MKKLIYTLLILVIFFSCKPEKNYPIYSLDKIEYVPDSLKNEQRTWVTETVRAASQRMSGGDYEDVDETILQAERTSRRLFEVSVAGLKKEIDRDSWHDKYIRPSEFNEKEKIIFDSLSVK